MRRFLEAIHQGLCTCVARQRTRCPLDKFFSGTVYFRYGLRAVPRSAPGRCIDTVLITTCLFFWRALVSRVFYFYFGCGLQDASDHQDDIPFLVGDSEKKTPSFATVSGRGATPKLAHTFIYIYI